MLLRGGGQVSCCIVITAFVIKTIKNESKIITYFFDTLLEVYNLHRNARNSYNLAQIKSVDTLRYPAS